jgi:hypothetical protein
VCKHTFRKQACDHMEASTWIMGGLFTFHIMWICYTPTFIFRKLIILLSFKGINKKNIKVKSNEYIYMTFGNNLVLWNIQQVRFASIHSLQVYNIKVGFKNHGCLGVVAMVHPILHIEFVICKRANQAQMSFQKLAIHYSFTNVLQPPI